MNDDQARLARIYRYPVKGLHGQRLTGTETAVGQGLPYDRRWAIATGAEPVPEGGAWVPRTAFLHLAKNAELTRFGSAVRDGELALRGPEGIAAAPERWFDAPVELVEAAKAYWDQEDATLSLINLETVAELGELAETPLDPLRFRGNLYLSGLPAWRELGLIGRRLRIGEVELEVLRPIARCRATSVNPATGEDDVNLPALLGARHGHIFCGVYARVCRAGTLREGATVLETGAAAAALRSGAAAPSAPDLPRWPRPAELVRRTEESGAVTSFWLRDPLWTLGLEPSSGQHLRVHLHDAEGPLWRSYTISGAREGLLRISVKRESDGRGSRLLHDSLRTGSDVLISGPFGEPALPEPVTRPVVLASAGIGITPMLPILAGLARIGFTGPVLFCHTARDGGQLALWQEAKRLAERLPGACLRLYLTRPGAHECAELGATAGRPSVAALAAEQLSLPDAVAHLCGPVEFQKECGTELRDAGLVADRLHYEVFQSPRMTVGQRSPAPRPGPFRVRFGVSGVEQQWDPESGSLLDLADRAGLRLRSGCREGACQSCVQQVSSGDTAYTLEPVLQPSGDAVLLCCAVPTSDLTIDA
ncbi:MOSC domain-containing protein [Sciscionella sediminilitoris]|uniref:MOSC domain-containing protein n=1 Tax=Sciscionella sediminilitoris TaxID=1445613 RepID=UPI0004DF976D|nr:MOSC domain-containing protein [Sciscionella sp. SE31]